MHQKLYDLYVYMVKKYNTYFRFFLGFNLLYHMINPVMGIAAQISETINAKIFVGIPAKAPVCRS